MLDPALEKIHKKLMDVRVRTDLTLRPTKYLREHIRMPDGTERPLKLRYYQIQMIVHLQFMNRFVVGDDMGLGKTLESIAGMAYVFEKNPSAKVLVLTKKSVVNQWRDEILRFTQDVDVVTVKGDKKQRKAAYDEFTSEQDPNRPRVMLAGYRSIVQDMSIVQDWEWDVIVYDEASMFKTPGTQIHQVCAYLGSKAKRVWGLTGTLIKNNLMEGYGIYKVVNPSLFPHTPNAFMHEYCVVAMQPIGKGRKVPVIQGYRKSDIERFRTMIEPFYLGRPKHQVASELPPLTTKHIKVGMSGFQHSKYDEALQGLLTIGMGAKDGGGEKEVTKLTAVTYCQEIVNHPGLIGYHDEPSEKLDTLIDLLTDGELEGEKVIVFTRFEKMVTIGKAALDKAKIKSVRITGAEDEDERKAAQDTFQDLNSDVKVVWITMAGSDAINLQSAKAIVFFDTPFSAGDYLQALGRALRIGSQHDRVYAIHLVASGTVDEKVVAIVDKKMRLIESVIGKRIKGDDDVEGAEDSPDKVFDSHSEIIEIFQQLQADAKAGLING